MKRKNKKPLNEQKVIKGQGWILGPELFTDELFIKKRYVATVRALDNNGWERIDLRKVR
mgnify:FL=1|jgi:hypothetical protein